MRCARNVAVVVFLACAAVTFGVVRGQFPMPKEYSPTSVCVALSSGFRVKCDPQSSACLGSPTFPRMLDALSGSIAYAVSHPGHGSATCAALPSISVSFDATDNGANDRFSPLTTDEGYALAVTAATATATASATLHSANVYGALRGLQTFVQLSLRGLFAGTVVDSPRFPVRGVMVDLGRNYISTAVLMSVVRLASWAKVNVLHLHISDAQSVPLETSKFPAISKGAFSPTKVYTRADIARLREFARWHAMAVWVEVNMPGHSYAWGFGYPEALPANMTDPYCDVAECPKRGIGCMAGISPAAPIAYDILDAVVDGYASDEEVLHMGGDELEVACWENDNAIRAMNKATSVTGEFQDGAQWTFLQKYKAIADRHRIANTVVWDDTFQTYPRAGVSGRVLPRDYIVQVWGGYERYKTDPWSIGLDALKRGHRVIMSPSPNWYFGGNNPGWAKFWQYEPTVFEQGKPAVTNATLLKNLLGGIACLWETTEDEVWWAMFWNTFLVGERLWSPITTTNLADAQSRLEKWTSFVWDFYNDTIQPSSFNISSVPANVGSDHYTPASVTSAALADSAIVAGFVTVILSALGPQW